MQTAVFVSRPMEIYRSVMIRCGAILQEPWFAPVCSMQRLHALITEINKHIIFIN